MPKIASIGVVGHSVFLPVPHFHIGGETLEATDIHFEYGGKGVNQATAAARFGADVAFLGAVGMGDAENTRKFTDSENIRATIIEKPGQTAYAAIVTDPTGATHVTVYQGVRLDEADVDAFADEIRAADILLLNNEVEEAVNLRALRYAKEGNTRIILNPAPARETAKELLDGVYLFTPNEFETEFLEDYENVVVTLGENGCFLRESGIRVPAVPHGKAVDTTGAGDTFNGVLAVMLAEGRSLAEAARIANTACGIEVSRKYAASSIPKRKEVL